MSSTCASLLASLQTSIPATDQAKLVKQEQQAIDARFERKEAETAQKIRDCGSHTAGRSICRTSSPPAARTQIARLAEHEARYVQFLESVIVQGLLQLLKLSTTMYARSKDGAVARRALVGAKKTYYSISGRQVEIDLDASLSNDLSGGVKLVSGSRRITLGNTLDERLRLLEDRYDGAEEDQIVIMPDERNTKGFKVDSAAAGADSD
ncbi:hypothetical protein F5888DRAFT_1907165 [Russula emetica]|nr:hypothetical protein F5888DRAFT_1907165 [Russula emetica]